MELQTAYSSRIIEPNTGEEEMDDPNAPATKRDLVQLEERLLEGMRDIQTEMLKAFYSYAQSADLRMRETDTMTHGMRERLAAVESRITEIERRLNMPPAA